MSSCQSAMFSVFNCHHSISTICYGKTIAAKGLYNRYVLRVRTLIHPFSKASTHSRQVIFSGIQPTGVPHIGNYLGALQQWVRLQNEASPNCELFFSVVDLHAITVKQDAQQLQKWKRQTLATLLAVGLHPERSTLFYQSSVY